MKLAKELAAFMWPWIYQKLQQLAESTDTRFDDIALEAADATIHAWIEE